MNDLDFKGLSFSPMQFVHSMRQAHPIFDDKDDKGHYKQQDADECYSSILQSMREPLKRANENEEDVIGNLFEIELVNESKCKEAPEEESTISNEKVLKLSCHIDNNNKPINMLSEGLRISLEGDIEKRSPTLGRDAVYHKVSKINKLVSSFILTR